MAASQYRFHGSRIESAGRRDALGRRRARTGSGTEGHMDVLERAWCAANAWPCLHRGRGQQRACASSVISHGLWQRRFGGAADIIGRKISLNDEPYEVIGVMPRNFYFMPSREIDIWMPASFPPWMRRNFTVARRPDRRAPQARRHTGAGTAVHGGIESAGDSEGFPRPPFGHRHASAGRDRGQNTKRADPAAERVGWRCC